MKRAGIPESLLDSLALAPRDCRVAVLLRHSHRPRIAPDSYGNEVELTEEGIQMAEELGALFSGFPPGRLHASPMPRAVSTAKAIARGAGWVLDTVEDRRLGVHGPFVIDASLVGPIFLEIGGVEMVRRQLFDPDPIPGMRPTQEGIAIIVEYLTETLNGTPALDVYVTHDSILAVVTAALLHVPLDKTNWPGFLEGLIIWNDNTSLNAVWRGDRFKLKQY